MQIYSVKITILAAIFLFIEHVKSAHSTKYPIYFEKPENTQPKPVHNYYSPAHCFKSSLDNKTVIVSYECETLESELSALDISSASTSGSSARNNTESQNLARLHGDFTEMWYSGLNIRVSVEKCHFKVIFRHFRNIFAKTPRTPFQYSLEILPGTIFAGTSKHWPLLERLHRRPFQTIQNKLATVLDRR